MNSKMSCILGLVVLVVIVLVVCWRHPAGRYESELMIVSWEEFSLPNRTSRDRSFHSGTVCGYLRDGQGNPVGGRLLVFTTPHGERRVNTKKSGYFVARLPVSRLRGLQVFGVETVTWEAENEIRFYGRLDMEIQILQEK